ncbi:hypothetical protein TPA0906_03380 [Streptomyces olivaceus]|nr:hypothetical protein TPA0906_03380 [Streptomyces olivaceus]
MPGEPAAEGELEVVVGDVGEGASRRAAHQGDQARRARQHDQGPQGVGLGGDPVGEAVGEERDGDERDDSGQGGDGLEADGEGQSAPDGCGQRAQRRGRPGARGGDCRVRAGPGRG